MSVSARTLVIFNPAAGGGQVGQRIAALRREVGDTVTLQPTTGPEDATRLARIAADNGVAVVVAAGGDGTVHEVANGLLESDNREVILSVWPLGSANDYASALGLCGWWGERGRFRLPRTVREADVGRVMRGDGIGRWFVNCLGLGFNGAVTLEARRIRGLSGMALYGLATIQALRRHFVAPEMSVAFDSDPSPQERTLALTVNLGKREGGFPLTPAARLDDGLFDVLHAGPLTRLQLLGHMPGMATGRLPTHHPLLTMRQCRLVEVASATPVRVHADGEFVCQPADGVRELRMEVVPGRLRVETWPATPPTVRALGP